MKERSMKEALAQLPTLRRRGMVTSPTVTTYLLQAAERCISILGKRIQTARPKPASLPD